MNNKIDLDKSFEKFKQSFMIITTKKEVEQLTEITLPFCSKSHNQHFMITENEDIIKVYFSELGYCSIAVSKKENSTTRDYTDVTKGEQTTTAEFWAAYKNATAMVGEIFPNPLMKIREPETYITSNERRETMGYSDTK